MKKYIDIVKSFIKKNIGWIVAIIVIVALSMGAVNRCNGNERNSLIEEINQANLRRHLSDSIATALHRQYIESMDSLQSLRDAQIASSHKRAKALSKENELLKKELAMIYKPGDVLDDLDKCNAVVNKQSEIITTTEKIVVEKDVQIADYKLSVVGLNQKYLTQVDETTRVKSLYNGCQSDNRSLIKEIEKENRFLRKNKGWIGVGLGVVGTLGTILILK